MLKIIELLFKTKEEAEQVLKVAKEEVLDRYGEITLMDIYELSGIEPAYSDRFKRWTNLDSVQIIWNEQEKSWSIILPKLEDQG